MAEKIIGKKLRMGQLFREDKACGVTPVKIEVSNLKFNVVDDAIGAFHSTQPYVTMSMDVEAIGLAIHKQKMKIQMTVSSRYYE